MKAPREFSETVSARAQEDTGFRHALLLEAVDMLISGDVDAGKVMLRYCVNASIGFERLAEQVGTPSKSLMRMLSDKGNPTARNLFAIIRCLQEATGVRLSVGSDRDAA
jgi:DNA-binding phage protein